MLCHLTVCCVYISCAISHFILHNKTLASTLWSPEVQMLLVMFFLMGLPIIFIGLVGVWQKLETHVRLYLYYFLATFGVDVGGLVYGFLVKDPCKTAHRVVSSAGEHLGEAFTCGVVEITAYFGVALAIVVEVYCLWTVWSFCEDVHRGMNGPALSGLLGKDEMVEAHQQSSLRRPTGEYSVKGQYGTIDPDGAKLIFGSVHHEFL